MLRKTFIPLLLAISASISIWFLSQQPETRPAPSEQVSRTADSFMENFTTRVLNSSGKTEYELNARKMMHFPYDDHAEFQTPHLTLYQADGERWTIASETGLTENGTERISLLGKVLMQQHPIETETPGINIHTRDVLILPQESYAETSQHVLITQGKNNTESIGLNAYLAEKRILLLSQVRGTYETRP